MWDKVKPKDTVERHCDVQLQERRITPHHLTVTVAAYDQWHIQDNGRYRLSKRFGDSTLTVIVSATTSASRTIGRVVTGFPENERQMRA